LPTAAHPIEQAAIRYLAGRGELPSHPTAVGPVLVIAARASALLSAGLAQLVAQECASWLGQYPAASLAAAARLRLPAAELVEPLIRSGIAAHSFRSVPAGTTPDTIRACPLAGLLLVAPLLPYRSGRAGWDSAELDADEVALLDAVEEEGPQLEVPLAADVQLGESDRGDALEVLDRLLADHPSRPVAAAWRCNLDPSAQRLSLGSALAARLAAQGDPAAADAEQRIRLRWAHLAMHGPWSVVRDLVKAEAIISGKDVQ
jgi:hypothetical protein